MKWQMPMVVSGQSWKKCACRESNSGLDSSQKDHIIQYTMWPALVILKLCYIGKTGCLPWKNEKLCFVVFPLFMGNSFCPPLWLHCSPLFICSFPLPYHPLLSYYRPGLTLCTPVPQHVYLYIYITTPISHWKLTTNAGQSDNLTNNQRQQWTPFTLENDHPTLSSNLHPFWPPSKVNEFGAPLKSATISLVHTAPPLHPSHHNQHTYFAKPTSHALLHHCYQTPLSPMYFVTTIR